MRKVKCKIQVTDSSFLISHFFASGSLVQPASPWFVHSSSSFFFAGRTPPTPPEPSPLPREQYDIDEEESAAVLTEVKNRKIISTRRPMKVQPNKVTKSRTQVTRMDYESSVDIEDSATRSLGRCQMQDVEEYTTVIKRIVKWQGMDRGHGYISYSTCYIMYRLIFPNKHMLLSTWKQLKCTLPLHIAQGKTDTGMWRSCIHLQQRS